MTSTKGNGFVPEVHQRFRTFAEVKDPGLRFARTVRELEGRLRRCESPIEQFLLIEVMRLVTEYELTHFFVIEPQIWAYYAEDAGGDETRVVGVRLDFLVCFMNIWDHIVSSHTGLLPTDLRPSILPLFAVECDGREFHTHESEIQRDKARDRILTSLGLTTIRFTGSEIFNYPRRAAWEVFSLFMVRFREILAGGVDRREFVDFREPPMASPQKRDNSMPPPLAQFKQLFLSERAHEELLRYDASNINDIDARRLGLLKD